LSWAERRRNYEQERWEYLFDAGFISKEEADAWAEQVWPSNRDEAEIEGGDAVAGEA
jgi:hypothetical protein